MTTPEVLARDYATVARALDALSNAWIREKVPSQADGLTLVTNARLSLARIAVELGIPPPHITFGRGDPPPEDT